MSETHEPGEIREDEKTEAEVAAAEAEQTEAPGTEAPAAEAAVAESEAPAEDAAPAEPETPETKAIEAAPAKPEAPAAEAPETKAAETTPEAPATAPASPPAGVKVRKHKGVYASSVETGQSVDGVFLVLRKQLPVDRAGRAFLALTLIDRTGRLEGRLWDDVETVAQGFQEGDHVHVRGSAVTFQSRLQVRLDTIEKVDAKGLDLPEEEFLPKSRSSADAMFEEIVSLVDGLKSPHLKALLHSFIDEAEEARRFKRAPAAQSVHHAWLGGLIEHTLSVMQLGAKLCEHYPQVDRDLVLVGCFLHDYGKIAELSYEGSFGYTDVGRLVGHLVMTTQWVYERGHRIEGFPEDLLDQVAHLVVSHHGERAYGSPKRPKTLEALLVHYADVIDARVSSFTELLADAGADGWTDYNRLYDRHLFRGSSTPGNGPRKSPKKRRRKRKKKPEGEAGASPSRSASPARSASSPKPGTPSGTKSGESSGRRPKGERSDRPPRGRSQGKGARPRKESQPALTFNPFAAALNKEPGEAQAPAAEPAPEAETAKPAAPETQPAPEAPAAPKQETTQGDAGPAESGEG